MRFLTPFEPHDLRDENRDANGDDLSILSTRRPHRYIQRHSNRFEYLQELADLPGHRFANIERDPKHSGSSGTVDRGIGMTVQHKAFTLRAQVNGVIWDDVKSTGIRGELSVAYSF